MACMEHVCGNMDCNYTTFNNDHKNPRFCPKCGYIMFHYWDEEDEHFNDEPVVEEEDTVEEDSNGEE